MLIQIDEFQEIEEIKKNIESKEAIIERLLDKAELDSMCCGGCKATIVNKLKK